MPCRQLWCGVDDRIGGLRLLVIIQQNPVQIIVRLQLVRCSAGHHYLRRVEEPPVDGQADFIVTSQVVILSHGQHLRKSEEHTLNRLNQGRVSSE